MMLKYELAESLYRRALAIKEQHSALRSDTAPNAGEDDIAGSPYTFLAFSASLLVQKAADFPS